MTRTRWNLVCSLLALFGGFFLLAEARTPAAFVWWGAAAVWSGVALLSRRGATRIEAPRRQMVRRFSRLLLFS